MIAKLSGIIKHLDVFTALGLGSVHLA